jgi:hypothetical protein
VNKYSSLIASHQRLIIIVVLQICKLSRQINHRVAHCQRSTALNQRPSLSSSHFFATQSCLLHRNRGGISTLTGLRPQRTTQRRILWLAIFIFTPGLSNKAYYRHYELVADVMRWLVHNGNPINQNSFRHQHEKDDAAAAAKKSGVIVLSLSECESWKERFFLSLTHSSSQFACVVLQLADRGHVRESFNPFIANGLL